jgi:aldehyde dehydrogenase (NAD+)
MEMARATSIGNGLTDGVTMGPLASAAQAEKYEAYLEIGGQEARLEMPTHACAPTGGHFVRPAIFTDVRPESRLAQEEVFSPILAFLSVGSFDEAVSVVNSTAYGLSAGVVTSRLDTALRFANEVEAGVIKINQPTTGVSMNAPFGGMKKSSTQTFKEQAGASMMQFYTHEKTAYFTA